MNETEHFALYLIPLLPLLGAFFALMFGKKAGKTVVTAVTLGSVLGAALIAATAVMKLAALDPEARLVDTFFNAPWIKAGDLRITAGLELDHLNSVLVLIITGIGFLIHVYASSYMEHDEGFTRFFGYLNLFTGAMLILVLGDSIPVTFVGWEGVGLCSYLLIGFWHDKDANAYAGRKAFVVNRVGDFGFLLAMFLIFDRTGTLKYSELAEHTEALRVILWGTLPAAYFIGFLVLVGATGKSAQIPLYIWLPDAMAGPTPVSALIHAATMVTAGVYVVARLHVVFEQAPVTLMAVAAIGALTAFFAATIGFAQRDLKKVLAYSTISQLGFMFIGVGSYLDGTSNYSAGVFHLMTHAFFKAGLFLGAGSVMHALQNEGDIMKMGGLKKWMPITRWTFLIYCVAIAGIPPLAGFWSKDAILAGAHAARWPYGPADGPMNIWFAEHAGHIIYYIALLAAGCTAFYMFRLYFLVFEGEYRGSEEVKAQIHESPAPMTGVLIALAVGTVFTGFLGMPNALHPHLDFLSNWLEPVVKEQARVETAGDFLGAAAIATVVSLLGITAAGLLYLRGGGEKVKGIVQSIAPLYRLVYDKYRIDELYNLLVVIPVRKVSYFLWKVIDSWIIDNVFVTGISSAVLLIGRAVRWIQNGDAQRYIAGVVGGTVVMLVAAVYYTSYEASKFDVVVRGRNVKVTARSDGFNTEGIQYKVKWGDQAISDATNDSVFQHEFPSTGKQQITVEAFDSRWHTKHSTSKEVEIKD